MVSFRSVETQTTLVLCPWRCSDLDLAKQKVFRAEAQYNQERIAKKWGLREAREAMESSRGEAELEPVEDRDAEADGSPMTPTASSTRCEPAPSPLLHARPSENRGMQEEVAACLCA